MPKKNINPDKKFLKKPEYPGGGKALRQFISAHLQFPQDAVEQNVQGTVTIAYEVTDEGKVLNAKVIKGLFPSCDAEALRLVGLLEYGKAFNHGVRLKSNHKINIHFNLRKEPASKIVYSVKASTQNESQKKEIKQKSYSYSITINKTNNNQ